MPLVCPRDGATLDELRTARATLHRCPSCRGVWTTLASFEAMHGVPLVVRPTTLALGVEGVPDAVRCPSCAAPTVEGESRLAPGHVVLACEACRAAWLDEATVEALRRSRSVRAPTALLTEGLVEVRPGEGPPDDDDAPETIDLIDAIDRVGRTVVSTVASVVRRSLPASPPSPPEDRSESTPKPSPSSASASSTSSKPSSGPAEPPSSGSPPGPSSSRPSPRLVVTPSPSPAAPTFESPFFAPGPAKELGVLVLLALVTWAFVSTRFGTALSTFPRIQFHELGHALVAWLTGRRALPLPIGLTFWSFERSWLLLGAEFTFWALLVVHGARTRAPLPIALGLLALGVVLVGVLVPLDASEGWLVAGGLFGEALLPPLAVLTFHLPLPARARWDFWRWGVVLAGLFGAIAAIRAFGAIGEGVAPLPFGSFVSGRTGDGDLERLLEDHGWAQASLRPLFAHLAQASLLLLVLPHPVILGVRWLRERREHDAVGSPKGGPVIDPH